MRLDPAAFNVFLAGIGQQVQWFRSYPCPCFSPVSAAPLATCKHCGGKGHIWDKPLETVLGVAGRDVQNAWREFGLYEDGDQVVIIGSDSPAYVMGTYDRVVALNRTTPFSIYVTKGVNDALNFPVVSVDRVSYIDADGELQDAPAPRVTHDGGLDWGEAGPPAPQTFTIQGRQRADFFVFKDSPFDRPHHSGQPLPRRVVLRRFDLYSR